MRKACAQPVDDVGTVLGHEHNLYSASTTRTWHHVANPVLFHRNTHTNPQLLSTVKNHKTHLLYTDLSTVYTGLITNTINICT